MKNNEKRNKTKYEKIKKNERCKKRKKERN